MKTKYEGRRCSVLEGLGRSCISTFEKRYPKAFQEKRNLPFNTACFEGSRAAEMYFGLTPRLLLL